MSLDFGKGGYTLQLLAVTHIIRAQAGLITYGPPGLLNPKELAKT